MVIVTTAAGCQGVEWQDVFQLGTGRPSQWHCNIEHNVVSFLSFGLLSMSSLTVVNEYQ